MWPQLLESLSGHYQGASEQRHSKLIMRKLISVLLSFVIGMQIFLSIAVKWH